jgi:mannose-6-phosphate isomerase-like protein (cupin superfamily)
MLIKRENTELKDSLTCKVWEYDFPINDLGCATALINGRYPEKGKSKNLECEQIYYIISGKGIIFSDKGDFEVSEGDAYFFSKNEKYFVEGDNLFVVIINAPKWHSEQYVFSEE